MDQTVSHSALRRLLWEWDPIGVADCAPPDEYDCMIEPLLNQLTADADRTAIARYFRHELTSHFELDPTDEAIDSIAERITTWWAGAAPTVTDPDIVPDTRCRPRPVDRP